MFSSEIWFCLTVGLQFSLYNKVKSLSTGAPSLACKAMLPRHGFQAQGGHCPYGIIVHPEKMFSNQSAIVKIVSNSEDEPFKGFLLLAKPTPHWQKAGQRPIGAFQVTEGMTRLNCLNGINNAVTHDYAQFMMDTSAEWRPPKNYKGKVTFIATVVKKYKEFWTGLVSKSLTII